MRCTVPVATLELHRDLAQAHAALLKGSTDARLGLRRKPGTADGLPAAGAASCINIDTSPLETLAVTPAPVPVTSASPNSRKS
jgi:hypothetical protein